jgi:hypothetical protein
MYSPCTKPQYGNGRDEMMLNGMLSPVAES